MNPKALEKYRIKKGLSITELSQVMGKTPGWYSRIRNGKQPLTAQNLEPLAQIFGVKPERLAKEYFSDPELEDSSSTIISIDHPPDKVSEAKSVG